MKQYNELFENIIAGIDVEAILKENTEKAIRAAIESEFSYNGAFKKMVEEKIVEELQAGIDKMTLPNFSEIAIGAIQATADQAIADQENKIREKSSNLIARLLGTGGEELTGRSLAEEYIIEMYVDHFTAVDECVIENDFDEDDIDDVMESIREQGGDIDIRLIEEVKDWGSFVSTSHSLVFTVEDGNKISSQTVISLLRYGNRDESHEEAQAHQDGATNTYKIRAVMIDGKDVFTDGTIILKDIRDRTTACVAKAYLSDTMLDLSDMAGIIEFERIEV